MWIATECFVDSIFLIIAQGQLREKYINFGFVKNYKMLQLALSYALYEKRDYIYVRTAMLVYIFILAFYA